MSLLDNTLQADARTEEETAVPPVPPAPAQPQQQPAEEPPAPTEEEMTNALLAGPRPVENTNRDLNAEIDRTAGKADFDRAMADEYRRQHAGVADARREAQANASAASAEDAEDAARLHRRELAKSAMQDAFGKIYDYSVKEGGFLAPAQDGWSIGRMRLEDIRNYLSSSMVDDDSEEGRATFDYVSRAVLNHAGRMGLLKKTGDETLGEDEVFWSPTYGVVFGKGDRDAERWVEDRGSYIENLRGKLEAIDSWEGEKGASDPANGIKGASIRQIKGFLNDPAWRNRGDLDAQIFFSEAAAEIEKRYDETMQKRSVGRELLDSFVAGSMDAAWFMPARVYKYLRYIGADDRHDPKGRFLREMRKIKNEEDYLSARKPQRVAGLEDIHLRDENGELQAGRAIKDFGSLAATSAVNLIPQIALQMVGAGAVGKTAQFLTKGASLAAKEAVASAVGKAVSYGGSALFNAGDVISQRVEEGLARGDSEVFSDWDIVRLTLGYTALDTVSPIRQTASEVAQSAVLRSGRRTAGRVTREALRRDLAKQMDEWIPTGRQIVRNFFKEGALEAANEAGQQGLSYLDNWIKYGAPGHKSLDEADWDLAAFALNMANQGFAAFWSAAGGSVVSDVQKRRDNTRKAEQAQSWMSHHMAETIARDVRDAGFDPDFHKLAPQEQYLVFRLFGLRASDHNARMGLAGAKRMLDFAEGRQAIPEGMDEEDLAEFKKKLEDKDALRKSVADWQKVLDDVRRQELGVMDYLEGPARAWARAWSAKVVSLPEDGIPSSVQSSLRAEEAERSFKRGRDIREGAVEAGETGADARISTWGEDENPDSSHRMMIEEQRSPDGKDFVIRVWNAYNKDRLPEGVQTEFEIGEDGATEDEVREKAKAAAVELTRFYDFLAQQDDRMTAEASAILDSIGRKGQTIRWVSTKAEIERTLQKLGVADRETRDNVLGRLIGRGDSAITVDLGAGRSAILAVRERAVNRANLAATLQHESFHADLIANAERNRTNKELLADIDPDGRIGEPPAEPPEGASPSAVNEYRRKRAAYDARVRRCLDVAFLGLDVDKSGRTVDWTTVTDEQIEAREEEYARASETVDGVGSSGTRPSYFRPMRRMLYNRYVARHPVLAAELRGFLADRFGIAESDDEAAAEFVSIVHEGAGSTAANDISGPGRLEYSAKTSEEVYKLLMGEDAVPPTREERERRRKEENDRLVREANERMAAEQQAEAEAIARFDAQQRESVAEKAEEAQRADEENDLRARAAAQDVAEKAEEQERQRRIEQGNAEVVARVKAKRAARKEQMRRSLQERASRAKSDRVNKIYWRFEDFLDKYHPDVMDDEAWQKGNAEQLARLEKGLRENNPQIVLEATEALRKKLRGRPSPTTEARAREAAEREQAEADRREQEAIRRENEAEEAGLRALEEQEEAQRQDERAEGERAAQGAAEAEAAEHADNPLAVAAERMVAVAARLEAIAKEKESKAKRGGKDKAAAEKARRLADRARKEAKAARAAQLGERTTSAYWANRPILDREDARDRRTARRRDEALQAEYDRLIAAGASEAQARRQANMAVTPARLNSRNVAGRPAVVAQNPGRFPIHEALEGRTLFGEVRPGDEAWEYVSDMTSRDAREAGLADRLLPNERGSRGLDSVIEALAENSPVLAARYGEDASGTKAAELVDEFLAENREIDDLVSDGALSEQERHNEDEEIAANRRRLGFYDERYEGTDDPERLAHIRDEVEARAKGMAPALPAEAAEAAAQDKAALDAQEELEAESPEAVQARRDSEAERAQQRFQESLVAQQEDEFFGDDYLAESAPRVRSRGGEADADVEAISDRLEFGLSRLLDDEQVKKDVSQLEAAARRNIKSGWDDTPTEAEARDLRKRLAAANDKAKEMKKLSDENPGFTGDYWRQQEKYWRDEAKNLRGDLRKLKEEGIGEDRDQVDVYTNGDFLDLVESLAAGDARSSTWWDPYWDPSDAVGPLDETLKGMADSGFFTGKDAERFARLAERIRGATREAIDYILNPRGPFGESLAEPGVALHLAAVGVPADRREEAKKAIQGELFAIDEMSKDGFLYPRSPEAEAAKPRKKISMRKPSPAPTVYTPEEKRRAFRALNSEEYAAENPADLALAKKMLDEGLTVSSVIGELYSGERFTWPVRGFRIAKPADVAALTQMLRSPYQESFKVVFTDARGTILDARVCSFGDIDACPVNPSTVLLDAPEGTVGVYVSHNHPSGDPRPSAQDVRITRSLGETCEMLGYELLDHVVTNGAKFHSMRDSGDAEFSEGRRMRPAGNLRPGEKAVPEFKRDVKAWEAVPVDERWQNDRPEEAFALAGRFRALETGGAFIVTLDRKCKLTGVSKMTPDELARPDAGREMLRRVQRVKEACFWMIVVGDAGIDLDRFARRSSGGMDARIGKPLVDVFLRDESGRFYSTRRQGVLRFDEYTGFEGATYNEMRRLGLTRDMVERYVAEHPAPQLDEGLDSDSTYDAEPARIRSRSATSAESAELEAGKKIRVYRAMQLIDGKLYPPMAAVVDGALVEPTELGKWYVADERPDLADENGRFKLDKGNGSSIKAAYNPYWHTSRSPLNDQFSSAWKRTNLVTVECEVPASELTSGYKAEKAKDAVGEMDWHSGPVSSKLAKVGLKRKVILSRYCKVLRVIPDAEVADAVSRMLKGKGISIPADVVTPSLRKELLARGVKVTPTKNVVDVFAWKQLDRKVDESTRMEFKADPFTRDWTVWSEPDYIAALPVHTLPQMEPISDRTDNNSVEKALQSLFARFGEVTNEDTEEKVVFNRGDAGKMMMQSGVDMRTFGPHLKHLFEKSALAWTEQERSMNEHKFHENVEQYRQYVAKFDGYTDVGHGIAGAAFVRFTVRVMNTGRHGVHAASISDISVIQKQKGGPQPVPARKLGGIGDLALRDKTLAKFLSKGKNEFSDPESRVRSRGGLSLDDVYGVRTRDVVEQIKLRRHEYDYDPQKRHVCDMVEEAFAKAQADPAWLKSVVDRALAPVRPGDQPPAFNTQEQGALMLDMHLRAEAADVAAGRLAALKASSASVEEIAAANARYAELEAARFAMEEAYIRQGKALSDAMNQRKAAFDKATGSFAGLMEAFEQATGRKPGASERARIRDAWREIERLRKALADAIRDVGNRDFDAAMAAIMSLDLDDLLHRRRSGPGKPGKSGAKGEADRSAWPKTREELEALAKERVKDLELDRDDPEAMRLLLRPFVRWVGKCLLNLDVEAGREMASPEAFRSALGVTCRAVLGEEFADWSDRTWGDIYSNYGVMTPASTDELKVRISQMTALQRLVSQLQDLENRMRPLKTGPQRVAMESQAEALRAEINAKMKELNLPIPEGADPSRFIKSPQEIQKEAMRKAIDRLERAIRDGVPFPKNADPIALDEEGQALRTLLEDLRKQYKEAFPLSDAEIVKRIVKAYEKAEERAQRELDAALAGNFRGAPAETREKLLRENDLRVQVMRERVAMLREARQELEDAAGPEAYYSEWSKAVRRAVQSKLNAVQRYHDWIANPSEFEKWQRKRQNKLDVGDDPAVKDAQRKLEEARLAWFKTLDDLAWADMNWLEKTIETAVGVSDISKRFIASADLSSIGVQAAVAAILRDPSLGWRTAKDALWAKGGKGFAFSEEKCRELLEKMQNDPEWHTVVDLMGIRISDWHADSGDFGEEYRKAGIAARRGLGISKILNDNKILRFGDRTYTMPLNLIRFAYAKQMIAHLTKMYGEAYLSTEQGRKDLKLLGRVVNMETGRGDWFTKNAAGSFVSKILWAPGKFAGQLQTMFLPVTLLLNSDRASARTRALIFKQCWMRPLIGWAILVMALRAIAHLLGDDDRRDEIGDFMETNPLNPMFGRVNLGGRRFSLSAGMESYISVATRVAMMKTASKYDEEKRLADPTGPIVNTLSNKFNPPVGIAWRLARRKDVDGTKLDNPGAVAYFLFKNLCLPITGTDFTKTALDLKPGEFLKREDAEARTGLLHKAVLLPLSFLGVSSNRYGWDAREADVANFDRLAKEFKALAKVYENKGGTYSANEIAKAREGILNLRGDPVLGLYAKDWTRGKELRDRLRQIENAIKAEGKERKPDKERLAQLEQLRGETLTAFHRLYHPQFARDAR